ncbi:acyltransferase [Leptolyngbya sp. FACHB-17]|uniref:acyltransferase n=1 Tax=unclassified Leptolyngbya TaxID=2650499 RepID=UPI00168088B3|nr:acyltransferase [Leptolyngbya sp. FACHB-17]MBD2079356.1 acyltransferase [Leptolyngbya sp. FACHB-17]
MNVSELHEITGDWNYRELLPNIQIGEHCWLERKESFKRFRSQQNPGLILGDRVQVYTWTTFNVEPSGMIRVGHDSILVGATLMCQNQITIGDRVVVSYSVTIADSDFHPINPDDRKQDAIANSPFGDRSQRPVIISRPVVIEDDVWIGIGAMILKGVRIGRGARIGAGSVITADVPAGATVVGNPATLMTGESY